MPPTLSLVNEDLTNHFYGPNRVMKLHFRPSAPMTQQQANGAIGTEVNELYQELESGQTMHMNIVYHFVGPALPPDGKWISASFFDTATEMEFPSPTIQNYDFDSEVWEDARVAAILINVARAA